MCSGFATIAGSVLGSYFSELLFPNTNYISSHEWNTDIQICAVAYIGLGVNPQALVSSCVMSIPASLAISKLRYPETEDTLTSGRVVIPDDDEHRAANSLHAFANGAWLYVFFGVETRSFRQSPETCVGAFYSADLLQGSKNNPKKEMLTSKS